MYQSWYIRAIVYICIGVGLFGYSNTVSPGMLLILTAFIYAFAKWRGEAEPVLDDPWASISELADDNDNDEVEEDDEEESVEIEIAPKKTRKMKR